MNKASQPFDFSQFVPGFDFLRNLAAGASGAGSVPGIPSMASWVAPTMSVEEVDKRIQELKTVQYWLEQNGHALKATIQALEVQKMTLSTLRGMNVRMEDLAGAFTRQANAAAAAVSPAPAAAAPEPEVEEDEELDAQEEPEEAQAPPPPPRRKARPAARAAAESAAGEGGGGAVDPLKWWGSLTEQFQQIASTALQDAAQLKMPSMAQPLADAVGSVMGKPAAARKPAAAKKSAKTTASAAKKKTSAAARNRTSARR